MGPIGAINLPPTVSHDQFGLGLLKKLLQAIFVHKFNQDPSAIIIASRNLFLVFSLCYYDAERESLG